MQRTKIGKPKEGVDYDLRFPGYQSYSAGELVEITDGKERSKVGKIASAIQNWLGGHKERRVTVTKSDHDTVSFKTGEISKEELRNLLQDARRVDAMNHDKLK